MSKENLFNDFTSEQIESFEDYYAGVAGEIDKRSAAWGYLVGTMSPCEPTHQPDESLRRAMDNMPSSQHGQRITFEECEYILVEPEHLEALEEAMLGLPKRESSQPDAITSNLAEALFCALTSLKTVLDEHDRSHQKRGVVEMGEKALTAYRSAPKREIVSLDKCAEAVKQVFDLSLEGPDVGFKPDDISEAVLRAAGAQWGPGTDAE